MTDYKDPAVIRFFTECYEKEKNRRIKWFMTNLEKIKECAVSKGGQGAMESVALLEKFQAEMEALPKKETKKAKVPEVPEPLPDEDMYKIMKPVPKWQADMLYSSEKGDGNHLYFHQRYKMNPEDKFYFPECNSWVYGWKVGQYRASREVFRPRVAEIKQAFYRKNNVARDPDHYRPPGLLKDICFGI